MSAARPAPLDADEDAAEHMQDASANAHERLLERHGLISHVLELSEDASEEDVAQLVHDASRLATNSIRLSELRVGVLFRDALPAQITDVAHSIRPLSPTEEHSAPPNVSSERLSPHADEGSVAALEEDVPSALQDSSGNDLPPSETAAEASTLARLEAQISALSARVEEITPATLADQIVPLVDELVTRRIEAEDRAKSETAAIRDAWKNDIAQFWDGMEAVLRLLGESAKTISDAGARVADAQAQPAPPDSDALLQTVADLKETLQKSIGEAQNLTETGLARIDASIAVATSDQSDALVGLKAAVEASSTARAVDDQARAQQHGSEGQAIIASVKRLEDEIANLASNAVQKGQHTEAVEKLTSGLETLQGQMGAITQSLAGLHEAHSKTGDADRSENAAALTASIETIHRSARESGRLLNALSRDVSTLMARPAPDVPSLEAFGQEVDRISGALEARLTEKGGVLSEAVEASARSMKNFWLSSEHALSKLSSEVERLSAFAGPDQVADLAAQFDAIHACQKDAKTLSLALGQAIAEVLATQKQGASRAS